MKRLTWIAIAIFITAFWTLMGLSVFAQDMPPAGTKQASTAQKFIYKNGDTVRIYDRLGATGIPATYYENATAKQLRDSLVKAKQNTDSSFVGKTANILGTGSSSGRSYNINSSPVINTIASDVSAVVNLAPGRPHDPNIIGSTTGTGADLAYILAGYDNVVDGLMSGIIGAHNRINLGTTHGTITGGSYHIWNGNNAYSASAGGTVDSLTNTTYSFVGSGQNLKATSSSYGALFGNSNTVLNQTNFHISGVNNVLTSGSNVLNNAIYNGRLDTIDGSGYSAILEARTSSIKGGNFNYIGPGFTNRIGTSATVNYSQILGGTLNVNNGTNSTIVNGSSNNIPSGLSNVYIFGSGITAAASNTTYVDALNAKNLTASSVVFSDANKKLVSTGTVPGSNGGTGINSYTTGNYLNAASSTTLQQRTPAQVLTDIGGAPSSGSANYIQASPGTAQAASIEITGAATAGTTWNLKNGSDLFTTSLGSIASFNNQPFFGSSLGYYAFQPTPSNTAARFYILPKGTPTGTTSKFEMFNTDYITGSLNYGGFNMFLNNINNDINIGPNRNGTGTRLKMILGGDYIGSALQDSAASIVFETDNTISVKGDKLTIKNDSSVNRFAWALINPETGSGNTGSDYALQTFDDDGGYLGDRITIKRSNGSTTFASSVLSPFFATNSAAGTSNAYIFQKGGISRWAWSNSSNPETGGDAGSLLNLQMFNDAGVSKGNALSVSRVDGRVSIPLGTINVLTVSNTASVASAPVNPTDVVRLADLSTLGTGTVTSVTSANADIDVATGTTTPVLTLNSGTGANKIVKRDASGNITDIVASGAQGDILIGSGAGTYARLPKNTTATRYLSNTGTNNDPAWSQIVLSSGVSGILSANNGGTGQNGYTTGDMLYATGGFTMGKRAIGSTGQVLTVSGGVPVWSDAPSSGTYTPTISNTSNISSSTPRLCHWMRIGNEVTVSGTIEIVPTGAGAASLSISLPVASNLATVYDLTGLGSAIGTTATEILISGNVTSDLADVVFSAVGSGAIKFSFTYTVIP